jgi:hypothetical protein
MALMGNWGVTKWGGQMLRHGFAFHAWVTGQQTGACKAMIQSAEENISFAKP